VQDDCVMRCVMKSGLKTKVIIRRGPVRLRLRRRERRRHCIKILSVMSKETAIKSL